MTEIKSVLLNYYCIINMIIMEYYITVENYLYNENVLPKNIYTVICAYCK